MRSRHLNPLTNLAWLTVALGIAGCISPAPPPTHPSIGARIEALEPIVAELRRRATETAGQEGTNADRETSETEDHAPSRSERSPSSPR